MDLFSTSKQNTLNRTKYVFLFVLCTESEFREAGIFVFTVLLLRLNFFWNVEADNAIL